MKTVNKLINFFTSTYYDNIKYKHATASLLKIFFERANKTTQTVSNLGNVYRNSKWSDLKIQNIKTTHVWSFIKTFMLFILLFISLYLIVFRLDNSSSSTFLKPLAFAWSYVADWTIYLFTLISLFFYYLQAKVTSYLDKVYATVFGSTLFNNDLPAPINNINNNSEQVSNKLEVAFSPIHVNLKGAENVVRQAYRVSDVMIELNQTTPKLSSDYPLFKNTNRVISAYLEVSRPSIPKSQETFSLSKLESSFTEKVESSLANSVYKLRLDGNSLTKANTNSDLSNILDYSINENLSVAKQSRWLLRSLPVSECLSNSNFTYTQAKLLVGNAAHNSLISSKNIWASSKANDLFSISSAGFNNSLSTNSIKLSSLVNYFEDSRSFINKKSYFTLQPRFSTTSLNYTLSNNISTDQPLVYNLNDAMLLDFNLVLLSNTLSAGSSSLLSNSHQSDLGDNLFITSDYLNYFTASHDNFVISLNTTNFSNNASFNFFDIQELDNSFCSNITL